MIDPRDHLISMRLKDVERVILVLGGKGGVGKSVVAASLALAKAEEGLSVGLLDLDIHGSASHLLLGVKGRPSESEHGLIPPSAGGVKVFSLGLVEPKGKVPPIWGDSRAEVMIDLLALPAWGRLDLLVVDMPPGASEELVIAARRLRSKASALVVVTPSRLSLRIARGVADLVKSLGVDVSWVVANMSYVECCGTRVELYGSTKGAAMLAETLGAKLCVLPLDPALEGLLELGYEGLRRSAVYQALSECLRRGSALDAQQEP